MEDKTSKKDPRGNKLNNGEYYIPSRGNYRFVYRDALGVRHQKTAPNLTSLREKEKRLYMGMRSELSIFTSGDITLNDMFDLYMGTKQNIRRSTRDNYCYMYDRFVRPCFGKKKLSEYKYTDLLVFYNTLIDKGLKYNTLDNIQTVIYPTFQLAYRDGIIPRNPAEGAKTEIKKNTGFYKTIVHPISKREQEIFLGYVRKHKIYGRWYALFVFMFGSGVRIGELGPMTWDDIDFAENIIHVKRALGYERNESGAMVPVIRETKTPSGFRTIPMLPVVREALLSHRSSDDKMNGKVFLFMNKNERLMNQQCVNRVIKRVVEDYNTNEAAAATRQRRVAVFLPHFTTHMIRHSFCARLCENETNIKIIQSIMGHVDIRTTMEIYADVSDERKKRSFADYGKNMGLGIY